MTEDELRLLEDCQRALAAANDKLGRLAQRHSMLVAAAEMFRPLQGEVEVMRLRGDPGQTRLVMAVRAMLAALDGEDAHEGVDGGGRK